MVSIKSIKQGKQFLDCHRGRSGEKPHEDHANARPTLPSVIHKEYSGKQLTTVADNGDDQLPMMSTDEMIDAMAQALAEIRNDLRTEFEDIVANAMGPLTEQVPCCRLRRISCWA